MIINEPFRAFRVYQTGSQVSGRIESTFVQDLSAGDTIIKAHYSSVNFKDALGATGAGKILRRFPLIAGIDVAGEIVESRHSQLAPGMPVVVTGCGLGEAHDGGYSEYVRVPHEWVIPLPPGLTPREAMIIGTAGFTAALCLQRMEQNGQTPEKGAIVVTGASGGVGHAAIQLFSQKGYQVIAVSGKSGYHQTLRTLGASQTLTPDELKLGSRPLESVRFGGAVDNVGGELLSGLLRHTQLWGSIACVGLAGGAQLDATVMPMILRGVSILGISSTNCPRPLRDHIWQHLATGWKPKSLESWISSEVSLDQLPETFAALLKRQHSGRTIVRLEKS